MLLLGQHKKILDKISKGDCRGHVVIRIGRVEFVVLRVANDTGREVIERAEVCHMTRGRILPAVDVYV